MIATESSTCPGTTSSGAGLVKGVTKSSPSSIISSGAKPVADINVVPSNRPPLSCVSYSSSLGVKLPSLVSLRNIILSLVANTNVAGNIIISTSPLPTKLCIRALAFVCNIVPILGSSTLIAASYFSVDSLYLET